MNNQKKQITFPVIVFTENDKNMYGLNYPFLMGDERFLDKAFKNTQIIDSEGIIYFIDSVIKDSNVLFWQSIKLMGRIVKFKPIYKLEPEKISLEDFKFRVKKNIHKNNRDLESKGGKGFISNLIDESTSFAEVIEIIM